MRAWLVPTSSKAVEEKSFKEVVTFLFLLLSPVLSEGRCSRRGFAEVVCEPGGSYVGFQNGLTEDFQAVVTRPAGGRGDDSGCPPAGRSHCWAWAAAARRTLIVKS